jgi:hypothetical protein
MEGGVRPGRGRCFLNAQASADSLVAAQSSSNYQREPLGSSHAIVGDMRGDVGVEPFVERTGVI